MVRSASSGLSASRHINHAFMFQRAAPAPRRRLIRAFGTTAEAAIQYGASERLGRPIAPATFNTE